MKQRFNRHQRSTARLGVVQLLFAHQTGEKSTNIEDVLKLFDDAWEKPDMRFMQKRFKSACNNGNLISGYIIDGLQSGWTIERIDPVLYAILFVATDEMLYAAQDTPMEILVKEYADLTADFFDKSETSFVNAYLNDLKLKLRQPREGGV